jgi:peptidoglycan-N-acetylglucosamine deacetylase
MNPKEKNLYLTFDDGPIPGPTEFVLDTLKASSCKATFFCIGDNVRKHPEVFEKILTNEHTIGNHTFNHLNGWKVKEPEYLHNVQKCSNQFKIHHATESLFRPPYGRITYSQIRQLERFRIIMWDVLTHDFDRSVSSEACLKNSIRATRNGSIVVFHDSFKAERNLRYILPRYIEYFLERGYQFRSLQ